MPIKGGAARNFSTWQSQQMIADIGVLLGTEGITTIYLREVFDCSSAKICVLLGEMARRNLAHSVEQPVTCPKGGRSPQLWFAGPAPDKPLREIASNDPIETESRIHTTQWPRGQHSRDPFVAALFGAAP